MLPVESLTEALYFLPLYDLDSVLFVSRQLSRIASKCVKGIRVWHFERVDLWLNDRSMDLIARREKPISVEGCENMADVLALALHNASFKQLALRIRPDGVIPLPKTSALEVEELALRVDDVTSADRLVDVIARFRKVQDISLYHCEDITNISPVVSLCHQKGIRSVTDKMSGVDLMAEE